MSLEIPPPTPPGWPEEREDEYPTLHVFGVDPGVCSGWAYLRCTLRSLAKGGWTGASLDSLTRWCVGQVDAREAGSELEAVTDLVDITRLVWSEVEQEMGDAFLVCFEDFVLLQMSSDRELLAPVRVTAAYRDRMRIFRYPFHRVSPSDSKITITDARLRNWNMYAPGEDHVRDALRVAIMGVRQWSGNPQFRKYVDHMQFKHQEVEGYGQ